MNVDEIQFTSEQRAWLGLGEGEGVRVLASGCRTIVLERIGGPDAAALPWDRDLVLTADVRAFALADVLQLLHASAKSGFLFFESREHAKAVYLHRGEVVFASSNQSADRLGDCLVRAGIITRDQFEEAERAWAPPTRFGKTLVERGYLTPRQLWDAVKVQVEEIVRSLFGYGVGTVQFWEGEVRPDNVVRLSLATRKLIAQGLRRRDELLRFLASLEDPRVRLEALGPRGDRPSVGTERALVEAIRAGGSFRVVCGKAGVDPLSGARAIQLLVESGAVRVARAGDAADEIRPGDEGSVRQCVRRHLQLIEELAAPIVALEGAHGIRERLDAVLCEASERYPHVLAGMSTGEAGTLDPETLVERALRFPGDREREVRLALGELVSYLEFELVNHAKIEDPESFLEAVEPLRIGL